MESVGKVVDSRVETVWDVPIVCVASVEIPVLGEGVQASFSADV